LKAADPMARPQRPQPAENAAPDAGAPMVGKTLLIVWQSMTGGTRQMAEAAAAGAGTEPAVQVLFKAAPQAGPADLLAADGYLFATPENLASMAGLMKDFFDRCYYPALGRIEGRPYATMVCAGSDGSGAARQIERICTGWRLRSTAPPLIVCTQAQTPEAILAPKTLPEIELARCRELGQALAAGLALGVF
jgi:flavodoxin